MQLPNQIPLPLSQIQILHNFACKFIEIMKYHYQVNKYNKHIRLQTTGLYMVVNQDISTISAVMKTFYAEKKICKIWLMLITSVCIWVYTNTKIRGKQEVFESYLWELFNEFMGVGLLRSILYLFLGDIHAAVADVFSDGGRKQDGLLTDHADVITKPAHVEISNVDVINFHLCEIKIAYEQFCSYFLMPELSLVKSF